MSRGKIHHLDLNVSDLGRSAAFYERVLGQMGYRSVRLDADGHDWQAPCVDGNFLSIGIYQARHQTEHDRYSPGIHHLAFHAQNRAEVDALYALLREIGANVLDPPAEYPQYDEGYYAVFFLDPDGIKLEFVYSPNTH
jgi:catechol 2,3-dioxygenase-like lactoylglutathione lyase family enzyme